MFTDGEDSASWLPNDAALQAARESSTLLYVVGTSPPEPESGFVYLLRRAAQTTGGAYLAAGPRDHLTDKFLEILAEANARYILSYQPQGVKRGGRHKLQISVRRRGVKVRGRQEYYLPSDHTSPR